MCKKVFDLSEENFYRCHTKNGSCHAGFGYICKSCKLVVGRKYYRTGKSKKAPLVFRYELLKASGFACSACGRKAPHVELQCDHIVPLSKGGIDVNENLQVLCKECNIGKRDALLYE